MTFNVIRRRRLTEGSLWRSRRCAAVGMCAWAVCAMSYDRLSCRHLGSWEPKPGGLGQLASVRTLKVGLRKNVWAVLFLRTSEDRTCPREDRGRGFHFRNGFDWLKEPACKGEGSWGMKEDPHKQAAVCSCGGERLDRRKEQKNKKGVNKWH